MFLLRPGFFAALVVLLLSALVISCCSLSTRTTRIAASTEIQRRVTNCFPNVLLLKPATHGNETATATQLAPLLIQEASSTNPNALWQDQPAPASKPPRVSFRKDAALINNRWHWQWTYTWNYANDPAGAPRTQGVRITLDSRDTPAVWEILSDTSSQDIIYVSQPVERAANAEYGPPLPGRKFSIERDWTNSSKVVVANVIEDGPTAMGPILYLQASSRDVCALICRCMPAQFQTLLAQKDYELLATTPEDPVKNRFPPTPLEPRLRLPSRF